MKNPAIIVYTIIIFLLLVACTNKEATIIEKQLSDCNDKLSEYEITSETEITSLQNTIIVLNEQIEKYKADIINLSESITLSTEMKIKIENFEALIKELENQNHSLQRELSRPANLVLRIFSSNENSISYGYDTSDKYTYQIVIVNENRSDFDTEQSDINIETHSGDTQVIITVIGKIFNFKLVSVEWDDTSQKFVDREIINSYQEVQDTNINIITVLPEGMPSEKIQWEDADGNITQWHIGDNGVGIRGFIIN